MSREPDDLVRSIKRRLTVLTLVVVSLCVLVGGASVYSFITTRDIHRVLCTFRKEDESKIAQGNKFLFEHPNGFAGIPRSQLRRNIVEEERTVEVLSILPCV